MAQLRMRRTSEHQHQSYQTQLFPHIQLPKASPALASFKALFAGEKLAKGSVLSLAIGKGGKLTVSFSGKSKACIASAPLCTALLQVYLGAEPVVPSAKAQVQAELAAKLK